MINLVARTGEVAQWLEALAALSGGWGSTCSAYMVDDICNTCLWGA